MHSSLQLSLATCAAVRRGHGCVSTMNVVARLRARDPMYQGRHRPTSPARRSANVYRVCASMAGRRSFTCLLFTSFRSGDGDGAGGCGANSKPMWLPRSLRNFAAPNRRDLNQTPIGPSSFTLAMASPSYARSLVCAAKRLKVASSDYPACTQPLISPDHPSQCPHCPTTTAVR